MSKSLRLKFVFIMLLLIVLLMTVVCVFLIRGVQEFYTDEFYKQMRSAFSNEEMATGLMDAAENGDVSKMRDILDVFSGRLGINIDTRNYYILDGETGAFLAGSDSAGDKTLEKTPNILTALTGDNGFDSNLAASYMDVALPVSGSEESYVVYIKDNRQTMHDLNLALFSIILEAVLIGMIISLVLSFVLSRALLQPILGMTKAAEEMAGGNFSRKIEAQSGDEIGILAETFNDMTSQLETTLHELKKSEKLRRDFVANVSHELRTPITSIRSYAETLVDNREMPKDMVEDFLRVIMNESDRMTKIVQDLLELSRFDAGNSTFTLEKFSLEQSVRDICDAVALEAKKHGHTVHLELTRLPHITGDRARIEQVLMNILSNALKYTPDGGTVTISSGKRGKKVWLKVRDTGIGIPEEDMPRVFERFYRVDKARSRESGGTGLGLSIAKEIIYRHGGEILMESKVGEGTFVTVILPVEGPENE